MHCFLIGAREIELSSVSGSDRLGEFGERVLDAPVGARVDAEFVVAAPDVLHQRVAADNHPGRVAR